ncbi:winged helix-turn-helix domain-containing protein [Enterococcus sp. BWR-S5]|uniref:winged helix-turn-helix domain-containing protein n=1 Tax=Enterococcus sp. BWR-S5 TaxID=2787714 RepID=UPI001920CD88|nr:winged helix-turn-helix domain-containing protein [Enterococcus sp. BWR-S5]MBL1227570.1 response regulator transcription factor [Enterococcus sp. BWR-S5]
MSTVSVINVAGKIEQSYIEELEKNEHSVRSVTSADVKSAIDKTDVIIIYNDVQQNMGEVCRLLLKIREEATSSVWVFSKQNSETDRLLYLQLGANHNIDKECPPEELQLIVKNEVKQHQMKSEIQQAHETPANAGIDISLNAKNQSIVNTEGIEVELTKLEYKMMSILYSTPDETVGYEELYLQLWNEPQKHSKARIANLVFHLRTKFQEYGVVDIDIKTVRSQGYRLIKF